MSNYTTSNLVPVLNPENGIPAIRIGEQVFTMAAGGVDVSDTTATAGKVLSGYAFYDSAGVKTSGSIQTLASSSYTPTTSNQVISSGVYLGGNQTILGDANLTSANIASGVTIFGVTGIHQGGTDISDTTATAGTVLSGYGFYLANGTKTSGTIPTVSASSSGNVVTVPVGYIASSQTVTVAEAGSASVSENEVTIPVGYIASQRTVTVGTAVASQTITPTTSDQTIASGSYLTGAATIKGDANLVAANIADGATIFGVTGTHKGATDFYKCASVTSGGSTWTGNKAVLSSGAYSFESAVTSGLTYGSGFTPAVGKIYDGGALVQVNRLFEGTDTSLVFYAPLDESAATAETGQAMTADGTVAYQTYQGIPCAYFNGSARLTVTNMAGLPVNGAENTIAGWFRFNSVHDFNHLFGYGDEYGIRAYGYNVQVVYNQYGTKDVQTGISENVWYHVAATWDGSNCMLYLNGVLAAQRSDAQTFTASRPLTIGAMDRTGNGSGYVAGIRVYNRALSAAEIAQLAAEFTPSAS